jgi:type IV pilus assembly protein PilA
MLAGRIKLGFSMLELMMVIAVIAILALVALPSFLDSIARKQIDEALPLADLAKKSVAAAWSSTQTLPEDNTAAGIPAPDKIVSTLVSEVRVDKGAVTLTFGNNAARVLKGKKITLRPAVVEDAPVVPVSWLCAHAAVPAKMTPKGANQTTVPDGYLPFACRGPKAGAKP